MGKKLSLARSEEDIPRIHEDHRVSRTSRPNRSTELLVEGRTGIPSRTSSNRNKRKETTTINKKAKGSKTKNSSAASKASTKDKAPNLDTTREPKSKGYKRHDKDREPNTGAEGKDRTPRRSASELGIEWIGDFCPDGKPHHLVDIYNFDGGSIFKCNNCSQHIWLPAATKTAAELDSLIDHLGPQEGYCKFLDKHRLAKIMVAKLQDLWRAKQNHLNKGEFLMMVLKVMEDKDYDRTNSSNI